MGSRNQIKENLKLQTGLYLYKTGQSKYWYVRILIPKTKKRISRSTEETSRVEAKKVAYEIYQDFMTKPVKYTKIDAPNSFKIFADKLIKKQTGMVRAGERSIRYVKDDLKILERDNDGLLAFFGKTAVSEINTQLIREYFEVLDENRDEPLVATTKNKHGVVLNKVLKIASEDDAISKIPIIPKFSIKDNPRVTFTEDEYKLLLSGIRKAISDKVVVRGHLVTDEFYYFILLIVHSFVRPVTTEAFSLRHQDISANKDGTITLDVIGKTGPRKSNSTPSGSEIYEKLRQCNPDYNSKRDFLFFPKIKNREFANRTTQRIFNHLLKVENLKYDKDDNARTMYSLRHYAIRIRLEKSKGKVNIFLLAKNAGTSVNQLERFYLKYMELTEEERQNLNTFAGD
jgi:hypothetical protein